MKTRLLTIAFFASALMWFSGCAKPDPDPDPQPNDNRVYTKSSGDPGIILGGHSIITKPNNSEPGVYDVWDYGINSVSTNNLPFAETTRVYIK